MNNSRALAALILICFLSIGILIQYRSNVNPVVIEFDSKPHSLLANGYSEPFPAAGLNSSHASVASRRVDYYVRHCVTERILGETPTNLETVPFEVEETASPEIAEQRKSSFQNIFKNKLWVIPEERKNEEQASGPGSTLQYAQEVIAALHSIIPQLKRELRVDRIRLLDIPCGDMVWMSRFLKTRDDVQYTGFDIVPDLINRHKVNYVDQRNWSFQAHDIVRDGLNESYDLILSRMMLQHLFTHDVLTVMKHFSESGSKYLLTTSFNRVNANPELTNESGRFRMLNLELQPFSLPPPICVVRDGQEEGGGKYHTLGLWQLPLRRVKRCDSAAHFRVLGFKENFYSCVKWL